MKKILFILFGMFICAASFAQTKSVYCEIVGTGKPFSNKVTVSIDYGQHQSFFSNDNRLADDTGKAISFNSMIDALNYMGTLGWEFVDAYVIGANGQYTYHWLLTKNISDTENINEGFKTKTEIKNEHKNITE